MRRLLLPSPVFKREAKRVKKRNPAMRAKLQQKMDQLAADAHDPRLRTHKLKGELADSWACSVGYDLRIVFQYSEYEGEPAVLLLALGSHDEVY